MIHAQAGRTNLPLPAATPIPIMPFWRDKAFVARSSADIHILRDGRAQSAVAVADQLVRMDHDGTPFVAADLSSLDAEEVEGLVGDARATTLKEAFRSLDPARSCLLGAASQILAWHRSSGYCSRCGEATLSDVDGRLRWCEECGHETFPRINPAVIALVVSPDGEQCLLVRRKEAAAGALSLIAGFVETGETFEQAVIREALEEADVVVRDPVYSGSQPWPFPASLMTGFVAHATNMSTRPDGLEMVESLWLSRRQVVELGLVDAQANGTESIEKRLLRDWLAAASSDAGEPIAASA